MELVAGHDLKAQQPCCIWPGLALDNSYARLPETLLGQANVRPLRVPELLWFNEPLARALGLEGLPEELSAAIAGGGQLPVGVNPIQAKTAGRSWGSLKPEPGCTRDVILGEHIDPHYQRHELSLAQFEAGVGAGNTALSLGSAFHQLLLGEALNAAGVTAPRILGIAREGDETSGEEAHASVIKVGQSPLTIGTFEYAQRFTTAGELGRLADYAIARICPTLMVGPTPYTDFLEHVCDQIATSVAKWESLGFVHSQLDTQLMPIDGTVAIAPHAQFLGDYDLDRIAHPRDTTGRYAFSAQPIVAHWNLCRLARALRPLIQTEHSDAEQTIEGVLARFFDHYDQRRLMYFRQKLGLGARRDGDEGLVDELLCLMHGARVNHAFVFRQIRHLRLAPQSRSWLVSHFREKARVHQWIDRYLRRLASERPSNQAKCHDERREAHPDPVPPPEAVSVTLRQALGGDMSAIDRFLATHGSH